MLLFQLFFISIEKYHKKTKTKMALLVNVYWCYDFHHNDNQHNDNQRNDNQHNDTHRCNKIKWDAQHYDTEYYWTR